MPGWEGTRRAQPTASCTGLPLANCSGCSLHISNPVGIRTRALPGSRAAHPPQAKAHLLILLLLAAIVLVVIIALLVVLQQWEWKPQLCLASKLR